MEPSILIVDDEPDILDLVEHHLKADGYRVTRAQTAGEALSAIEGSAPDLVILDLMLPDATGYDILREMRRSGGTREVPVIMLTARTDEQDRIRGLASGADDYVVKPFSPRELVLRVRAVLRRTSAPRGHGEITCGPLLIDREGHRAMLDGTELDLTSMEFKLLLVLVERRGKVLSRAELLKDVWNANPAIQTRTVDMHVRRLRSKLGAFADRIETIRGAGYRFGEPQGGGGAL